MSRKISQNIKDYLDLVDGIILDTVIKEPYDQLHTDGAELRYVVSISESELESMYEVHDWYRRNLGGFNMEHLDYLIRAKVKEEIAIRDHPGVKEAYDRYQTLLNLT